MLQLVAGRQPGIYATQSCLHGKSLASLPPTAVGMYNLWLRGRTCFSLSLGGSPAFTRHNHASTGSHRPACHRRLSECTTCDFEVGHASACRWAAARHLRDTIMPPREGTGQPATDGCRNVQLVTSR